MSDQEKFHYTLPEDDIPSRWDGLSQPARDALASKAAGPTPAEQLLPGEAARTELSEGARAWAEQELQEALIEWRKYGENVPALPNNIDHMLITPSRARALNRLFEAHEALDRSSDTNPDNIDIGDTMHLVLIPWRFFYNSFRLKRFRDELDELRSVQDKVKNGDFIQSTLQNALLNDGLLYRDGTDPATRWDAHTYLRRRIDQDGPWGIMLAQTSNEAGVSRLHDESPNALTKDGTEHFSIAGHNVDAMGIFEWLSLTFQQEDPSCFSDFTASWLLANRMTIPGTSTAADKHLIPTGRWDEDDEQFEMVLEAPEESKNFVLPRLAVL